MLSFVARSSNVSTVAVTQSVANGTKSLLPAVSIKADSVIAPPQKQHLTTNSLAAALPKNPTKASFSIGGNIRASEKLSLTF